MWIEIVHCKNSKMLVRCIYRVPGMREEQERGVREELGNACGKGRILILWDFQLPGIDCVQEQGKSRAKEDFVEVIQHCFSVSL